MVALSGTFLVVYQICVISDESLMERKLQGPFLSAGKGALRYSVP
jgi:hypothetical protein